MPLQLAVIVTHSEPHGSHQNEDAGDNNRQPWRINRDQNARDDKDHSG